MYVVSVSASGTTSGGDTSRIKTPSTLSASEIAGQAEHHQHLLERRGGTIRRPLPHKSTSSEQVDFHSSYTQGFADNVHLCYWYKYYVHLCCWYKSYPLPRTNRVPV